MSPLKTKHFVPNCLHNYKNKNTSKHILWFEIYFQILTLKFDLYLKKN